MSIITRVNQLLADGKTFCLATVISSGRPEISAGHKQIVLGDGTVVGDEGGLCADLQKYSQAALNEKKPRTVTLEDGLRVFLDVLSSEAKLLICGAGHIAMPLARFANAVGFDVTVLDDRSDFAHPSRFPDCTTIAENFTIALRDMTLGSSAYVVIITRGHEHDVDCLVEILNKETAYVGLIGSRRRVSFVLRWLEEKGFSPQRLQDVFTPIGIPIGAESPEEIALSIVSELVCMRRKGSAQAHALRAAVDIG